MSFTIAQLNEMSQSEFVAALGCVFEDTPAIAQAVWHQRPFGDVKELHQRMVDIVQQESEAAQLKLVRVHPDLASKAKMAEASVKEQSGVGLDRLSPEEFEQFQDLNGRYKEKFGFPFIVAVRNHTKTSILAAFRDRLQNTASQELQQALTEIAEIARFRLQDLVQSE